MGVVSRRRVYLVGVGGINGCGWNLWVWLVVMVVRRYIGFLILIPTPLVYALFCIPTFCSFKNVFLLSFLSTLPK